MMLYDVHVYAICWCKVTGIEADNQAEAVKKADAMDMHALFDHDDIEFAEDPISYFLVDEVGDKEYEESQWWKLRKDGRPVPYPPTKGR